MSKVIMVQGTMSSAGKSLLVAALCRIFRNEGLSVCPFKSQNMALNSFITDDGFEMGRAQVMQAEAAGIRPDVRMNPILLKPSSDTSSQIIVNGKVHAQMKAKEYFSWKQNLWPEIQSAYDFLSNKYDVIVIEGAGSPVEINLRENDIVNMGLAKRFAAPVILVADIDRGGVFAQMAGTELLLGNDEKELLKGFVINKLRGDKSLLEPGISLFRKYSSVPVIGTIPFMDLHLDDEDSVSDRLENTSLRNGNSVLKIKVLRLPHISNFSDFTPFENYPECSLSYVENPEDLQDADCVIIPGTKNTLDDLRFIKNCGLSKSVIKLAEQGTPVLGICGGYQMLGVRLCDSSGLDSGRMYYEKESGLGLLPVQTSYGSTKIRTRVSGTILGHNSIFAALDGVECGGYEIHQGISGLVSSECEGSAFAQIKDSVSGELKADGFVYKNIAGTYIHGIFENGQFLQAFLDMLADRKNLPHLVPQQNSYSQWKDKQYEKLAETVKQSLDMDYIHRLLSEQEH